MSFPSKTAGRSEPLSPGKGEVFDRPAYANVYDRLIDSFLTSHVTFEIVCEDAMRHYKDATWADAVHHFAVMVKWGNHFLRRMRNEAIKKENLEIFSAALVPHELERGADPTFPGMLAYSKRLSDAVADAEAYGRSIGLFIAERSTREVPFDMPKPEEMSDAAAR